MQVAMKDRCKQPSTWTGTGNLSRGTWSVRSRLTFLCSWSDHLSGMWTVIRVALLCCGQPLALLPSSSVCMSAVHSRNVCQERWECPPFPPRSVCKVVWVFVWWTVWKSLVCVSFKTSQISVIFQITDLLENLRCSFIWRQIDWLID
jgi:hypothetical protein